MKLSAVYAAVLYTYEIVPSRFLRVGYVEIINCACLKKFRWKSRKVVESGLLVYKFAESEFLGRKKKI